MLILVKQMQEPLLKGPDDMMILKIINLPELHLYLGLGNKIFDECHTKTIELKAAGLMRQTLYQWAMYHLVTLCV